MALIYLNLKAQLPDFFKKSGSLLFSIRPAIILPEIARVTRIDIEAIALFHQILTNG
ncbi:MAG: hypothetical protein RM338_34225 [Nostoc sp. DedQUE12a]|nr:hypothetical protein [Nostoc sp. DedQUE12a]